MFFAHCHPHSLMIHKPSFMMSLSQNLVPSYLLNALCAISAPLSKQPRIRTAPARFSGKPFAQTATSLMFDDQGNLTCERSLSTAQALCLLQKHGFITGEDDNAAYLGEYLSPPSTAQMDPSNRRSQLLASIYSRRCKIAGTTKPLWLPLSVII